MPTYTAQDLIDRAKAAADMHDNFVSNTVWLKWLTQERYALDLFIARSGWPLDFETTTITVGGHEDGEFVIREDWDILTGTVAVSDFAPNWSDEYSVFGFDNYYYASTDSHPGTGPFSLTYVLEAGVGSITATESGNNTTVTFDPSVHTVGDVEAAVAGAGALLTLKETDNDLRATDYYPLLFSDEGGVYHDNTFTKTLYLYQPAVNVMAILAVHQVATDGRLRLLKYKDAVAFLRQRPESPVVSGSDMSYFRTTRSGDGLALNFYPDPSTGTEILVTYIRAPSAVTAVTDTVSYPMGWEERLVLGMARRALEKEESDSSAIRQQMREIDQHIEEACWGRAIADAPTVRNRDDRHDDLPPRDQWVWV